jgi:hypothetical protein
MERDGRRLLANVSLETKTILQWSLTLDGKLLQEVREVWEEVGYTLAPAS